MRSGVETSSEENPEDEYVITIHFVFSFPLHKRLWTCDVVTCLLRLLQRFGSVTDFPCRILSKLPSSSSSDITRVEVPLTFDAKFFQKLQEELESLDALQAANQKALEDEIAALSKEITQLAKPSKISKTDLYRWRELFDIYLQAMVFFSTKELDHGSRDSASAVKQLQWFQAEVVRRNIIPSFKLPASHQALNRFIQINITLLKCLKFQEINKTACNKILKSKAQSLSKTFN